MSIFVSFLFQCILIIYTDTCLRPFESDMPNLERRSPGYLLPTLTFHLSPLTFLSDMCNTEAWLWPSNSESADQAALAAVKETHPCLTQFTPVTPVALLLWCCAPALLVSDVRGSRPGSDPTRSGPIFLCHYVKVCWLGFGNDEYLYKWKNPNAHRPPTGYARYYSIIVFVNKMDNLCFL